MCLDKIDSKADYPTKMFGWKIFNMCRDCLHGQYYNNFRFPIEKWIKDTNKNEIPRGTFNDRWYHFNRIDCLEYQSGFHLYTKKEDAEEVCSYGEIVKKVEFEDVVAIGTQGKRDIIVARRIKVLR